MQTVVSVVIATYNHARYLDQAVGSVLAQRNAPEHEIIVVDDGSTDGTPELLGRYVGRVQMIRQENKGLGAARNTGIAAAQGQWVAFLDSDDWWEPDFLARTLDARSAQADVVNSLYHVVDAQGSRLETFTRGMPLPPGEALMRLIRHNYICGSSVCVRRQALRDVGGFTESRQIYVDYHLWLTLAALGYRFALVEEPLASIRVCAGSLQGSETDCLRGDSAAMSDVWARLWRRFTPAERRACARRLGEMYGRLGRAFYQAGDAVHARKWFAKALRYQDRAGEHVAVVYRLAGAVVRACAASRGKTAEPHPCVLGQPVRRRGIVAVGVWGSLGRQTSCRRRGLAFIYRLWARMVGSMMRERVVDERNHCDSRPLRLHAPAGQAAAGPDGQAHDPARRGGGRRGRACAADRGGHR